MNPSVPQSYIAASCPASVSGCRNSESAISHSLTQPAVHRIWEGAKAALGRTMAARMSVMALPLLALAALGMLTTAVSAETYPTRPIKLIVPFPPGGPVDVMARVVVQRLSTSLGQVIIDNRPGVGGGDKQYILWRRPGERWPGRDAVSQPSGHSPVHAFR